MKVRELKNKLVLLSETTSTKNLDKISHWVNKLRFEDWHDVEEGEMNAIKKLETLAIVSVKIHEGNLKAKLTEDGKELYRDFMALGYY